MTSVGFGGSRHVARSRSYTGGQYSFAQVPSAEIQRSVFNRSCGLKTAFDTGFLVPIFCDEALPGDTMKMRMSSFVRMTTPYFAVMDNMFADFFFFAVPIRLIWDNWEKFNGAQTDPGDSTDFLVPTMSQEVTVGTLSDYIGIPIDAAGMSALEFCSFWHRGYNLCWNEWFRDENLQDSLVVDKDDGPDNPADYVLKRRGKRHDYFTSCLPWPQKGDPVSLPLGATAPVISGGTGIPLFDGSISGNAGALVGAGPGSVSTEPDLTGNLSWDTPSLVADLSAATAATINDIRQAFQIQRLLERDARGGTRYTEIVRSHFQVLSPDQRLQRPEYLGGGSVRINVNPVARTNFTPGASGGTISAFVTASADGVGFNKSFTEHCILLGLVQVRADLTYQQGLERQFNRRTRYDFYWPALSHLGEQAVLNKEIYATGTGTDDDVFGYQERYAEYRYKPSRTSGVMRSTAPLPIDQWHLGIEFGALPVLNAAFIEDNSPFDRVVVSTSEPEFFGDFWFEYRCARPMPTFSVPGLIDHF